MKTTQTKHRERNDQKISWGRGLCTLLAAMFIFGLLLPNHSQAGSWFTGKTINGQTLPLSAGSQEIAALIAGEDNLAKQSFGTVAPAVSPVVAINLTVSLEANPQDDDRLIWVQMMEHFADAIYEATNGAHKLGQVRIFRDSDRASTADIFWKANTDMAENRTPHVKSGGGVLSGGRINMYELAVWRDRNGNVLSQYDYLNDPENSGYTMAHEMGHYYYGLFDEYDLGLSATVEETVNPSIMTSQWQASAIRSSNKGWLNFSVAAPDSGDPGDFQNTERTEQHRKLGASAWEVLARDPSLDPSRASQRSAVRSGIWLGPRKHFPELAAAAPGSGETPPILLPNNDSRSNLYLLNADGKPVDAAVKSNDIARDVLEVIWMEEGAFDTVIVIDKSGSMSPTMMSQARQASRLLVNQLELGRSRVAVLAYNQSVSVVHPFVQLQDENQRQDVLTAIDGISAGGWTAIGDGARQALNILLDARQGGETQVVFLLTDGINNRGENPRNVIPDYQDAQIPIFAFGYGPDADVNLMRDMADSTGGRYYFAPTELAEIARVFEQAGQVAGDRSQLSAGRLSLSAQAPENVSFRVDNLVRTLNITFVYVGSADDTEVKLIDPSGTEFLPSETVVVGNETQKTFSIVTPDSGRWSFEIDSNRELTANYNISGNVDGLTYSLDLTTADGRDEYFGLGAAVTLYARLASGAGIAGAEVQGQMIHLPTGSVTDLVFNDDGTGGDLIVGDGVYSARFVPSAFGQHRLVVQASNPQGNAYLTDFGALSAPGPNGEQHEGFQFRQITEDFSRSQSIEFTVRETPMAPSFIELPFDAEIDIGSDAHFTAFAEGNPTPSIQWQVSTDGGDSWVDLVDDGSAYAGSQTNELTVFAVTPSQIGNFFRAQATNPSGMDTSEHAELQTMAPDGALYSLTVVPGAFGTIGVEPDLTEYSEGSEVKLTALPDSGFYIFSGWSGDAVGRRNPITITMDENKYIEAQFEAVAPSVVVFDRHVVKGEIPGFHEEMGAIQFLSSDRISLTSEDGSTLEGEWSYQWLSAGMAELILVFDAEEGERHEDVIELIFVTRETGEFNMARYVDGDLVDEVEGEFDLRMDFFRLPPEDAVDERMSVWFGGFNDRLFDHHEHAGWIAHSEHSWVYVQGLGGFDGFWMWDDILEDWLWTSFDVYPFIYSHSNGDWLFYSRGGTPSLRHFFDYRLDQLLWFSVNP